MGTDHLVSGLSYPLKGADYAGCLKAHTTTVGGTFPVGLRNLTWHGGIHLGTDKPIRAVADGEVVAYRFKKESFTDELEDKQYSNSFVLIRHLYRSNLGNTLDFFSLYMHLYPEPAGEFIPEFLCSPGYEVNGTAYPVPGQMLFDKDANSVWDSLHLVPMKAKVEIVGEKYVKKGKTVQEVSYTAPDGKTYEGIVHYAEGMFQEEGDATYVAQSKHKCTYYSSSRAREVLYNCCKDYKGLVVRKDHNDAGERVALIPNGTPVSFSPVPHVPGWGQLESPLPETILEGPFYIKTSGQVKQVTLQQLDMEKIGDLVVPPADERPFVSAGSVLGAPSEHFGAPGNPLVHIEIFTLEELTAPDSMLNDPMGERYFSKKSVYSVPVGRERIPAPIDGASLEAGDYVQVLQNPDTSSYAMVQVTGLIRTVEYRWLDDRDAKKLCPFVNESRYWYVAEEIDSLNTHFNGWIQEGETLYLEEWKRDGIRRILFPCGDREDARVWIPKSAIGKMGEDNNTRIGQVTCWLYSDSPPDTVENVTDSVVAVSSSDVLHRAGKTYAYLAPESLVDVTGLEPESAFTWPGFEFLYEEPPNHDAFLNLASVKSSLRDTEGRLDETPTARELKTATEQPDGTVDIQAVYGDEDWARRLSRLIVRCPSEWHYSDSKYVDLEQRLGIDPQNPQEGDPAPDRIRAMIKKASFWEALKSAGVFDDYEQAKKYGKEVYAFHPLSFVEHLSLLSSAGISREKCSDLHVLARFVRAIAGGNCTQTECCKALCACLYNRLKKYEWSRSWDCESLVTRYNLPQQDVAHEELHAMIPHIAEVMLTRGWSQLPSGYVHFHSAGESLSAQPWDSSVLQTDAAKTIGGFTFYKYVRGSKNYATELTIRELRLVSGGDKGASLPASPGECISVSVDNAPRPYRYDIKTEPQWSFEFDFTIPNGTPSMEAEKQSLVWQLRYFRKSGMELEEQKLRIPHEAGRFSLTIPSDAVDYSVDLIPCCGEESTPMDEPFRIALKKKEHVRFNGSSLRWFDENGQEVPFDVPDGEAAMSLTAISGSPRYVPPKGQDKVNEGPIPEGVWWMMKDDEHFQCIDDRTWWERNVTQRRTWPGGEERWGKYRLWLEPDGDTDVKGRSNLCIIGNASKETGGNMHVYSEETAFNDLAVFKDAIVGRVEQGGRLQLIVDYSRRPVSEKR